MRFAIDARRSELKGQTTQSPHYSFTVRLGGGGGVFRALYAPSRCMHPGGLPGGAHIAIGVGEIHTGVGTISQTDYGYTFQKNVADMSLMDYQACYFSGLPGRFTQPDNIIPEAGDLQSWIRFSTTKNIPRPG